VPIVTTWLLVWVGHTAAIPYYLKALASVQGKRTCIHEECQWVIPKTVKYLLIKEIKLYISKSAEKKAR